MYDSTDDTNSHIRMVGLLIDQLIAAINFRRETHDASKLQQPEKDAFDRLTPLLRLTTYGSDEYKNVLNEMHPALEHHYYTNSHHPEHYSEGIAGMDLIDLIEMLADWKAATMRHDDGDLARSLDVNRVRFNIEPQLFAVLVNTARRIGWTK